MLADLRAQGVRLKLEDGRLRYEARQGAMTAEVKAMLRARKDEILAFLRPKAASGQRDRDPIPKSPPGDAPLSFQQQSLWFIDRLEGAGAAYNLAVALRLRGGLDAVALERAATAIVARHEILRTIYPAPSGKPVQRARPAAPLELAIVDLSGLAGADREQTARRLAERDAGRRFDLAAGPALRLALARLDRDDHALLAAIHHISADGWSAGVFVGELARLYSHAALTPGRDPGRALPPPAIQYRDYAHWQRRATGDDAVDRLGRRWRDALAGAPALLALPTDRPRPAVLPFEGGQVSFEWDAAFTAALRTRVRALGATLFHGLHAGFTALLARYSGQDDIVIGVADANRRRPELEPLIGHFVNTQVYRLNLADRPDFGALTARARDAALDADAYADVPFEKLVELARPERTLAHAPIFQVLFGLQNAPAAAAALSGLTVAPMETDKTVAKFDMDLSLSETADGGLAGVWTYNRALFDGDRVARMAGHYRALLDAFRQDPARRPHEACMLTPAERALLLSDWDREPVSFPAEPAHRPFERASAADDDAPALGLWRLGPDGGTETWISRRALDRRANGLAHRLRKAGVGPETLVGVYLDRSPELIVAMLAVLKSGAAYTPLDPDYPSERIALMIADSGLSLLIAAEDARPPALPKRVATMAPDGAEAADPPALDYDPERLAYVIYTSGSSGRPKGVAVTHGSLANFAFAAQRRFPFEAGDRAACVVSFSFDIFAFQTLVPLNGGAAVLLLTKAQTLDMDALTAVLPRLTFWHGPATLTVQTVDALERRGMTLSNIRMATVGGEAVPRGLLARMARVFPRAAIHEDYGPTEATVLCTAYPVPPDGPSDPHIIGAPLANTRARVYDRWGNLAPVGLWGELRLGGPGVARGYINRTALTADRFRPDEDGGRFYRTGDLARFLADGALELRGRIDRQVKIRGFRVELGEIENALAALPGVARAAAVLAEGSQRLIAFVAAKPEATLQPDQLRERLRAQLPDFMTPAAIRVMDALPRTPAGKLDYRSLARTARDAGDREAAPSAPPRTPTERVLADIWRALLDRRDIGVDDNFFELGGDSILSIQAVARAREAGLALTTTLFFERQTIARLAQAVEAAPAEPDPSPDTTEPVLSFAQERIWFESAFKPSAAENMSATLRLAGALDAAALERALTAIVARHQTLRTGFHERAGRPDLIVADRAEAALAVIDLQALPDRVRDETTARLRQSAVDQPFDLTAPPLLRARLLRAGPADHALTLTTHHIVSDAWSTAVFVEELSRFYGEWARDRAPDAAWTAPPRFQYGDYAARQRHAFEQGAWDEAIDYWRAHLDLAAPPVRFAEDAAGRGPRAGMVRSHGSPALLASLEAVAAAENASLFMALAAAFTLLLHRHSGRDCIAAGFPIAGREAPGTGELIGCFLNLLPLPVDCGGAPSFRTLLGRTRASAMAAYARQELPFEKLVEALQPPRDLDRPPLFDILLNMHNTRDAALAMPGLAASAETAPEREARHAMTVYFTEGPDGLALRILYRRALYTDARASEILDQFLGLLTQVAANPDRPIGGYSLVTPAARALLPDPATPLDEPRFPAVTEMVAAQAARGPDRAALVHRGGVWSYRQLTRTAARLAGALRSHGLRAGETVALHGPASPELIAGSIAVLQCGGVMLTLDPSLPAVRRAAMARAARAALILDFDGGEALDAAAPRLSARQALAAGEEPPTLEPPGPDQPAYVFFTSGATGEPKAILGGHKGLSHFIAWQRERFAAGPRDRVAQLTRLSFDAVLRDLFLPLTAGGALCLPEEPDTAPETLFHWLSRQRVSVIHTVPSLAAFWLDGRPATAPAIAPRLLFLSGEPLGAELVRRWRQAFPGTDRIVNFYGVTETTLIKAYHVAPAEPEPGPLPAGRPLPQTQLLVLGADGGLCGVGELGEAVIRTPFGALGYLAPSGAVTSPFGANPHAADEGARLYWTGDLARFRSDGTVDILGRRDFQLKIRGVRVEPGEVEAALETHPGVSRAVVVAHRPRADAEPRLVAYLQAAGPLQPEPRGFLRDRLPEAMIPDRFIVLAALPLTATGKVDRASLPDPATAGQPKRATPPRNPIEELLAGVWADLLRKTDFGVHDDFFALGGHSLLAIQVAARIRELFDVPFPLRAMFEADTIAAQAAKVNEARGRGARRDRPRPIPRTGRLPLSFAQARLWFLNRMDDAPAYNIPAAMTIAGPLDAAALDRAVHGLALRHEALRAAFPEKDGQPRQRIAAEPPRLTTVIDLGGLPKPTRPAKARDLAAEAAYRRFDLARGPLLRFVLLRLAPEDWLLAMAVHHIVADMWSMNLMVRELTARYRRALDGDRFEPPPTAVQFVDYAAWQQARLRGPALDRELAFWRGQLADPPADLRLPADRPHPATPSHRGGRDAYPIDAALARDAKDLARELGATPFMVFQAAFALLLSRYSGQTDLVLGVPVANRDLPETRDLIGFFVNTLAMRCRIDPRADFRALTAQVRQTAIDAFIHAEAPFEQVVEAARPDRAQGRNPLFQAMFTYEHAPPDELAPAPGLVFRREPIAQPTAKLDLTLGLYETQQGLSAAWEYSADLFDRDTIARMARRYAALLAAIVAEPARPLAALSLLEEGERRQLTETWNTAYASDPPQGPWLHQAFEAHAASAPQAAALIRDRDAARPRILSQGALNAWADGIAADLRRRGVGPETVVAVHGGRSPAQVAAMLAALKTGAAYLPLDPAYPDERLRFMVEDAAAALVLTDGETPPPALDATVLTIEWRSGPAAPAPVANAANTAYVIYTSGSTGRPKGAALSYGALANLYQGQRQAAPACLRPRVLQFAANGFDASIWDRALALANGGALILADSERTLGEALARLLRRQWISHAVLPPAALAQLPRGPYPALRYLCSAGEACPPFLANRWADSGFFFNAYGPTEASVWAALAQPDGAGSPPIGRPLPNAPVYVLDERLEPAPTGMAGQLMIAGAGLARGYVGRSDLSAAAWIPNPYGPAGSRLYASGDRARFRADGQLEFLGRADRQVKLRGFRVELAEIEAALAGHPRVRQAAAMVLAEASDAPILAACAAVGESGEDAGALRRFLEDRLPPFMVPARLVALAAFPLTPNGKIDRAALTAALAAPDTDAAEAPRTPTEEIVAGLWRELLDAPRVGPDAHFFELGGHSLLAAQVIARAQDAFGVEIPLRLLFDAPTLAGFGAAIDALRRDGSRPAPPPIEPVPPRPGGVRPLTLAQQRLWFLDRLEGPGPAYNIAAILRLTGPLSTAALHAAFRRLLATHEVLRAVFVEEDGQPSQRIAATDDPAFRVVDLSRFGESEARRLADSECQTGFDLARGPLMRALLLRLARDRALLTVNLHHIVADGWSMGLLVRDIAAWYRREATAGGADPPAPPAVQYGDYAEWQQRWLAGATLDRQLDYWRTKLADLPTLDFPADRPRPRRASHRGAAVGMALDSGLSERLRGFARRRGLSLFMTLTAAFKLVLARYSGLRDIVIGAPSAGRRYAGTERLIGFFINNLTLRASLADGDAPLRFDQLTTRVRDTVLEAHEHQDVPFERLVEALQPARDLSRNPLFQVYFNMINLPSHTVETPGLTIEPLTTGEVASKFDLTLYAVDSGPSIQFEARYNPALFEGARMETLLGHLRGVLEQAVALPDKPVEAFTLGPSPADLDRPADVDWRGSALDLFEAWARRTPDRIALTDAATATSYAAVAERSRRLAGWLRARGVRPFDVVALQGARRAELAIAALGALRAGAVFVILDPADPPARLAARLALTRPTCLVELAPLPEGWVTALDVADIPRLAIDALPARIDAPPEIAAGPDDPAYLAFTSGSSGAPKAIAACHGPLARFQSFLAARFGLAAGDRFAMISSLAHDPLKRDIFHALGLGATLAAPDDDALAPGRLAAWMARRRITAANLTPSMGRILLADADRVRLDAARALFFVGEPLPGATVAALRAMAPRARAINLYGATETQQALAFWPATAADDDLAALPLGAGFDGVRLAIFNADGGSAGAGELGEIHFLGPFLASGYLADPALTAARFVPAPPAWGGRMYRTGDLGRFRADGAVVFAGRADRQLKLRGFRVEPTEAERALTAMAEVAEAAVTPWRDRAAGLRLAAYVAPAAGHAFDAASLRARLRQHLPDYLVPAAFIAVDRLPRNAAGKLDRHALPTPETAAPTGAAPRTPLEEILAAIWAEALGLDRAGVHDNFFDLGGHSLLAMRVLAAMRQRLGVSLAPRQFFEAPTVAEQAETVSRARHGGAPADTPPIEPVPRDDGQEMPLSFAQRRLWFLERLQPDSAVYNVPFTLRLRGPLDAAALDRALTALCSRHQSLRTQFGESGGEPVQRVLPPSPTALATIDLSRLAPTARLAALTAVLAAETARPFGLGRGRPFRAVLFRTDTGDHVLRASLHHIVTDAWSTGILARELAALYRAKAGGSSAALPALPVQYPDFAHWQQRWLRGPAFEERLAWWLDALSPPPPALALPIDYPRPPRIDFRGAQLVSRLEPDLVHGLERWGRTQGATLFMVLLAGFETLLSRFGGQTDFVVGAPVANRGHAEIENLIGFFVNTLPLRADLSGDPTFAQMTARVRDQTLEAYARQDIPFETIVERTAADRDLSRHPVFQVTFGLINTPGGALAASGLDLEPLDSFTGAARFDLSVQLVQRTDGLSVQWIYRVDLFRESTIARLAAAYRRLLAAALAAPETPVADAPLLDEAERERALVDWNAAYPDRVEGPWLHELFAARAAAAPDATAVVYYPGDGGERRLSYGALEAWSNGVAAELAALGVGPDTPVAVRAAGAASLPAALLGALKAGGVYLPLDPALPRDRQAFMVRDAGAAALLTDDADPPPADIPVARLDPIRGGRPTTPALDADHGAYLIYTSGTTGRPKGALLTHGGLANLARVQRETMAAGPSSRTLQFAAAGFDASIWEMTLALADGGALAATDRDRLLGDALADVLDRARISHALLPPSTLAHLPPRDYASLRCLVAGGEACPAALAARWAGPRRFFNAYGPTEATVWATLARLDGAEEPPPIGRPLSNGPVYVLDRRLRPAPIGVAGLLYLAGAGLGRGYFGRPGLTAAAWLPNPYGPNGSRLYASGDRVRYREDGQLVFLGRADHQVKVRGFRIELGEVETTLARHPRVRRAAALARADAAGSARLVAYVEPQDPPPDAAALRAWLADALPAYMIPDVFVFGALPLLPNHKIDRAALATAPLSPADGGHGPGEPPVTPVEEILAGIWKTLLDQPRVGRRDHFFEAGGHSLLATRLVSQIRAVFDTDLPLRAVFEAPILADLALRVEAARGQTADEPLRPFERGSSLPLSYAQQRLWFLHRVDPQSPFYNISAALRIDGPFDARALEAALDALAARHETLRTVFREVEGEPRQIVLPDVRAQARIADLSGLPPDTIEPLLSRLADRQTARPFDLARAPAWRAALFGAGPESQVLVFDIHHIIADGWSMGVLIGDFVKAYRAATAGRSPDAPPLAVQYGDYTLWQRQALDGAGMARQTAYWSARLADAPAQVALIADKARPATPSRRGENLACCLDPSLAGALRELSARHGATLFMTLLAVFKVWLYRASGQTDLTVGAGAANRNRAELEPMIGFFVNSLALRTRVEPAADFARCLDQVRETALDAYANQDLPFNLLVERLRPDRASLHNPLFNIMFTLQNMPSQSLTLPGAAVRPFAFQRQTAKFDLFVSLTEAADGSVAMNWEYSADLFARVSAARMMRQFRALARSIAADPRRPLARLDMAEPAAQRRALMVWAGAATVCPAAGAHELFAAAAAAHPQRTAVSCGSRQLTFGELDRRANRLAHRLRRAGLQPEGPVAVCMARSPETIIALLAILKAGGCYTAVEAKWPAPRIELVFTDAGVAHAVADADWPGAWPQRRVTRVDPAEPGDEPAAAPDVPTHPERLAYVSYTSGSTGRPKGVAVSHRAVMRLIRQDQFIDWRPGAATLQFASLAFDASTLECWGPLLRGGRLVVAAPQEPSLAELARLIERQRIATLWLTASLFNLMIEAHPQALRNVRWLLAGGEALSVPHAAKAFASLGPGRLLNGYGPTETTTFATVHPVRRDPAGRRSVPIGKPIGGTRVYVVDRDLNAAAVGAPGELAIAGEGLARGYLGQPALTADRFTPNPFAGEAEAGARLYRSGDRVRWLAGGVLEFLGRIDDQIKIRGFRVEPGEIAALLEQRSEVSQALVLDRELASGERGLVAYAVAHGPADSEAGAGEGSDTAVDQWRMVFDEQIYTDFDAFEDPALNLSGWVSSYDGAPIPETQMQTWVDDTLAKIEPLAPESVLEIGCGSGLLLFRLAPACREYHGSDISDTALAHVRRHLDRPDLADVDTRLHRRPAHDFEGLPRRHFDLALLNSVVQYFPSLAYLEQVIAGAIEAVNEGGALFIGDVRNFALHEDLAADVALFQTEDETPLADLRRRVRADMTAEDELLVDPAFFHGLQARHPRVRRVETLYKEGVANELTLFRYDVRIHLAPAAEKSCVFWRPGRETSFAEIERALREDRPATLALAAVPNRRLDRPRALIALLAGDEAPADAGALRRQLDRVHQPAAADFWALGRGLGYETRVYAAPDAETCDLLFTRADGAGLLAPQPANGEAWSRVGPPHANQPGGARDAELAGRLRAYLCDTLPEYMVPAHIVVLDEFPLTTGGKIDRRALPVPAGAPSGEPGQAPRTAMEELLADVWRGVLGPIPFGVHDNFFELGGHSLLATRVVSAIRDRFRVELPLRQLFERPTIAGLAETLAALKRGDGQAAPPLRGRDAGDGRTAFPLSFAQTRLWFLGQLQPDSPAYNSPATLRLRGPLDVELLRRSLNAVRARHESLRTTFPRLGDEPVQKIHPPSDLPLPLTDLSALPQAARDDALAAGLARDAAAPFDLADGPLIRAELFKLEERDHVFRLNMHHIVTDGWSMGALTREIAEHCRAFAAGEPPNVPELPVQYADFAEWQRRWLQGETLDRQLAYWKETLAGPPPNLELPTDLPRPAVSGAAGERVWTAIPAETAQAIRALGHQRGATTFMTLLAAFQTLMARYSGQSDFAIGSPIANRTRAEVENLIGFFVNNLALRADLSGDPSFAELLDRVRDRTLDGYAHQDAPFDAVVDHVGAERDLSRHPVFQVAFGLMNAPSPQAAQSGLAIESVDSRQGTAIFDLTVQLFERPHGLGAYWEYRVDLWRRPTIERMADHMARLLGAALARPETPISRLPMLSDQEREQALVGWNAGYADAADEPPPFHRVFEARAAAAPDAVAIEADAGGSRCLSYRAVDELANALAHDLRQRGVGPDAPVGVCARHSEEATIAMTAVMKAGGAYLPLDPNHPRQRLAWMAADAGARLIVVGRGLASPVEGAVAIGTPSARRADPPAADPAGGSAAYVIYTSGTTGRPKGAILPHSALANLVRVQQRIVPAGPGARALQFASLNFDASVWETTLALGGGAVSCISAADSQSGPPLGAWLRRKRISCAVLTPTSLASLPEDDYPTLQTVISAGEACPAELAARWSPGRRFFNAYGPTEATVWATIAACDGATPPSIGRPLPHAPVYLLDRGLQPTPIGVLGELLVAGAGLGRGYLGRPARTAAAWIPNPYGPAGSRLYRTGDMARWRVNGEIEFIGRIDGQIKIRGFRVELGEIERALDAQPGVTQSLALAWGDGATRQLAAYILAADTAPDTAALRAALARDLPAYMVPATVTVLGAFPRTPNGKIDRRALPDPRSAKREDFQPPHTDTERKVAQIWQELLDVERVGLRDHFFELGGNSLIATQVVVRLERAFDVRLPLARLFEEPTLMGLVGLIEATRAAQSATAHETTDGQPAEEGRI